MFYWTPQPWPEGSYKLGSVFLSILLPVLCVQKFKCSWNLHISFFLIFGMRLWVTVELCGFFKEKSTLGKNDEKCSKMAQTWNFSTILIDLATDFCLKHWSLCTNPMYGKNLFLELLLEKLSIILQDYVIRHISGWTQLISLIVCTSTDYQKRKTSNLIFLIK